MRPTRHPKGSANQESRQRRKLPSVAQAPRPSHREGDGRSRRNVRRAALPALMNVALEGREKRKALLEAHL